MAFALIGKWNNLVQEVNETSSNLTGIEKLYEIETNYSFEENPVIPDKYLYKNGIFSKLSDFPLVNIDNNWNQDYSDYKSARVALYVAMMTKGGFNNLSDEEKRIASKWFIVERTERSSVHTLQEQVTNGKWFDSNSKEARRQRFSVAMSEIYNRLTKEEVFQVLSAMGNDIVEKYITYGTEGTVEGDLIEGLFDYIEARNGTAWSATGLAVQTFIPSGMANCSELATKLMDILKNGNY